MKMTKIAWAAAILWSTACGGTGDDRATDERAIWSAVEAPGEEDPYEIDVGEWFGFDVACDAARIDGEGAACAPADDEITLEIKNDSGEDAVVIINGGAANERKINIDKTKTESIKVKKGEVRSLEVKVRGGGNDGKKLMLNRLDPEPVGGKVRGEIKGPPR